MRKQRERTEIGVVTPPLNLTSERSDNNTLRIKCGSDISGLQIIVSPLRGFEEWVDIYPTLDSLCSFVRSFYCCARSGLIRRSLYSAIWGAEVWKLPLPYLTRNRSERHLLASVDNQRKETAVASNRGSLIACKNKKMSIRPKKSLNEG